MGGLRAVSSSSIPFRRLCASSTHLTDLTDKVDRLQPQNENYVLACFDSLTPRQLKNMCALSTQSLSTTLMGGCSYYGNMLDTLAQGCRRCMPQINYNFLHWMYGLRVDTSNHFPHKSSQAVELSQVDRSLLGVRYTVTDSSADHHLPQGWLQCSVGTCSMTIIYIYIT